MLLPKKALRFANEVGRFLDFGPMAALIENRQLRILDRPL